MERLVRYKGAKTLSINVSFATFSMTTLPLCSMSREAGLAPIKVGLSSHNSATRRAQLRAPGSKVG